MFGIGWTELVLLFIIVLVFFGPKRLPEIGLAVGKALRMFKEATRDVRESLSDVQSEFQHEIRDIQKTGHEFQRLLIEESKTLEQSSKAEIPVTAVNPEQPESKAEPEKTEDAETPNQPPLAG